MQGNPEKIERFAAKEVHRSSQAVHHPPSLARQDKRWLHQLFRLFRRGKIPQLLLWFLILGLIAIAAYYYRQYKNLEKRPVPVAASQQDVQSVTDKVGKLMILPQGETPTLATVSDKSKLGSQTFFKNAEDGDKILIYAKAKVAILYRPSSNKIVNVAPLFTDQNSTTDQTTQNNPSANDQPAAQTPASGASATSLQNGNPTQQDTNTSQDTMNRASTNAENATGQNTSTVSPASTTDTPTIPLKVEIENGSSTVGAAGDAQTKLAGIAGVTVMGTGDAKGSYANTIVVDLTKKNPALVLQIAQAVSGQIESLPAGETAPTGADVLVIVGTNSSSATTTNK